MSEQTNDKRPWTGCIVSEYASTYSLWREPERSSDYYELDTILQCLNSHEALVEALQQIDGMLVELNQCNYDADDVAEQNHSVCVAIQTARAALAKVKT